MSQSPTKTIFVTGTDTDVGKTYVASLTAKALHDSGVTVGVYKPVASGCVVNDCEMIAEDAVQLWESAGRPRKLDDVCPQKFLAPLAPTAAAKLENKTVDQTLLRSGADVWSGKCEYLIVEGAGGLFSPLADGFLNVDLCKQFPDAQVILVAANRLGVIHQTLCALSAAAHHGIRPIGIILSSPQGDREQSAETNASQIASLTNVPILAEIAHGQQSLDPSVLKALG